MSIDMPYHLCWQLCFGCFCYERHGMSYFELWVLCGAFGA